ncbi:oxidoreductase [Setomelanomma holmii]|uniref:Oxidoreductase n=1 Tax=Setomelanomma holmii TaxID=210430 RepID=A0A9P4GYU9_9PLEO|nr:oxidoreductase [Setomelanomma holmii]
MYSDSWPRCLSKAIRFAVVGTGLIGPRHAEAIQNDAGAQLVCIVDPHPSASIITEKFQCPLFQSVKMMLEDPHAKPDAALAGVHVLCEKPISTDVASARELIECARLNHRHLLIGHHRRFNRYVVAVKQHLPSLGRLIAINSLWTIYKSTSYFDPPTDWRRLDSAGPVFINLIHEVDILHYWYGPIARVHAEKADSQRNFDAEEGAAITFRFASGMVGTFLLSDAVVSPHSFEAGTGENPLIPRVGQDFHRVFGSEGTLSLVSTQLEVPDMKIPFEAQIEHFVRVIRGSEEPSCDGAEGLRAVIVCEAVKKSMRVGLPVDIAVEV